MYTLFIIDNKKITQHNGLSKSYARALAHQALLSGKLVQLLTPTKKYINLVLKDFTENGY